MTTTPNLGAECPVCGAEGIQWKEVKRYHYTESGLDNVWLFGGVRMTACAVCHEELTYIEQEFQLLQVIAVALLNKDALLTGPETRFLREAAHLTQEELASLLRLSRQPTISDRERRREPVMGYAEDLGFRILIMNQFVDFLRKNQDECFLAAAHWPMLTKLAGVLSARADTLSARRPRKTLRLLKSDSTWWISDTLPAAA